METNEERRDVAKELRYTARHSLNGYSFQKSVEGTVFGTIGDRSWREIMTRLADLIEPELGSVCVWTADENGNYYGSCGIQWSFIEGGISENFLSFCPWCGSRVVEQD